MRQVASGLIDGGLTLVSPDVSVAAALALVEAKGSVNAEVSLAGVNGQQTANIRGDVRALTVNDIKVASADINGTATDLFGVPVINGSANASGVVASGVEIKTLAAKASQSGTTTSFDAQAALTTGTNLDLAGSLTPIDGGYRLAMDRAQLQQGQLSAKLSQPTVLQVAGPM